MAKVYSVPYETLMEKAGYPNRTAEMPDVFRSGKQSVQSRVSVLAGEEPTPEEEELSAAAADS